MRKSKENINDFREQQLEHLSGLCQKNNEIAPELYQKHDVKRGLRDTDGRGVLTGLTEISTILAVREENGVRTPIDGELYYRGINIRDLVGGFVADNRFGFEETVYLLLLGQLPNESELDDFCHLLGSYRSLPTSFVRNFVLSAPNANGDIMNCLARNVLTLYSFDKHANDISISNVLRQCLQLIATLPMLAIYDYQAYSHYIEGHGLYIHNPSRRRSTAENILLLLRDDKKYTDLEARILDMALVLHAEHGGGNNSTFTTHVVSSSHTDTYSSMAASLCSLKGPRHGGANIKARQMFEHMMREIRDWDDDDEISAYLTRLLNREAFDRSGLIYGMGHAIYSLSDPRAEIFKAYVKKLSQEKGREDEFRLYENVARLASSVISANRKIYKGVSPNIDFYSGFVYSMLNLPKELYTPLFAVARIAGWSAHRIEELVGAGKILRPAYMGVHQPAPYVPLHER